MVYLGAVECFLNLLELVEGRAFQNFWTGAGFGLPLPSVMRREITGLGMGID